VRGFRWTDRRAAEALGLEGKGDAGGIAAPGEREYAEVSTDTRTLQPGALFVAVVGKRFDGHDFLDEAAARGARGAVVSRPPREKIEGLRLYRVDDTLVALGRLARYRRDRLEGPVVGITGSSGKTTTKELLRGALGHTYRVHATRGNRNNRVGVPLTILEAPGDAEVLVLELGTNEPGEIRTLTEIAAPGYGILTTVSETHLEKLGSLEGVVEEKLDLLRGLVEPRIGAVSDDPPFLAPLARELVDPLRVAGWSEEADADLRPSRPRTDRGGRFRFGWREEEVALRMPGRHAVVNALLALAAAEELGVPPRDAARGVGSVEPPALRGEVRRISDLVLLLDCYNANPQSVEAALDLLEQRPRRGGRVAVLGTMLELGDRSDVLHREVLADTLDRSLDLVVVIGAFADAARTLEARGGPLTSGPELRSAGSVEEAGELLADALGGGEVVLLKASRGVALEGALPRLEERFGRPTGTRAVRDEGEG